MAQKEEEYRQYRLRAQATISSQEGQQAVLDSGTHGEDNSQEDAFTQALQQRIKEMKVTIARLTKECEENEQFRSTAAQREEEIRSLRAKCEELTSQLNEARKASQREATVSKTAKTLKEKLEEAQQSFQKGAYCFKYFGVLITLIYSTMSFTELEAKEAEYQSSLQALHAELQKLQASNAEIIRQKDEELMNLKDTLEVSYCITLQGKIPNIYSTAGASKKIDRTRWLKTRRLNACSCTSTTTTNDNRRQPFPFASTSTSTILTCGGNRIITTIEKSGASRS